MRKKTLSRRRIPREKGRRRRHDVASTGPPWFNQRNVTWERLFDSIRGHPTSVKEREMPPPVTSLTINSHLIDHRCERRHIPSTQLLHSVLLPEKILRSVTPVLFSFHFQFQLFSCRQWKSHIHHQYYAAAVVYIQIKRSRLSSCGIRRPTSVDIGSLWKKATTLLWSSVANCAINLTEPSFIPSIAMTPCKHSALAEQCQWFTEDLL